MSFGMDKCIVIHTATGKIMRSLFIHEINQLSGEDSYNYFGLLEGRDIINAAVTDGAWAHLSTSRRAATL